MEALHPFRARADECRQYQHMNEPLLSLPFFPEAHVEAVSVAVHFRCTDLPREDSSHFLSAAHIPILPRQGLHSPQIRYLVQAFVADDGASRLLSSPLVPF